MKTAGQIAYEGYFHYSKGKSLVSGAPLPEWGQQAPGIREAWEAAAMAVSGSLKQKSVPMVEEGPAPGSAGGTGQ